MYIKHWKWPWDDDQIKLIYKARCGLMPGTISYRKDFSQFLISTVIGYTTLGNVSCA
jgi:hypothetical protein